MPGCSNIYVNPVERFTNGSNLPSWISYSRWYNNVLYSIYTTDPTKVGTYSINATGQAKTNYFNTLIAVNSTIFTLTIENVCPTVILTPITLPNFSKYYIGDFL